MASMLLCQEVVPVFGGAHMMTLGLFGLGLRIGLSCFRFMADRDLILEMIGRVRSLDIIRWQNSEKRGKKILL